jgi:hypothetical protein
VKKMDKYYEFSPEELMEINGGDSVTYNFGPVAYTHDLC